MKRKSLATLLSGFLTVCLTGVGFAAWLITGGDTEVQQGNITAEAVSDKRCTVSSLNVSYPTGTSINFGPNSVNSTGWLRTDAATENLTATVTFTVSNTDYLATSNGISIAVTSGDKYQTAFAAGYVAALPSMSSGITLSEGTAVPDTTNNSKTYSATITFGWGTAFGGVNPYEKYSAMTNPSDDEVDAAFAALSGLKALDTETFTVTVTTTSK